jgi:lipid A 4'-phosphatase
MSIVRFLGEKGGAAIRSPAVWIPAVLLVGLTLVCRLADIDTSLTRWFYVHGGRAGPTADRWPLVSAQPWIALYDWGCYPAWILGVGGLAVWFASFFWNRLETWRAAGLFYALLLALGPGVLVNLVLKPYWERPRPDNTVPFGGQSEFVPVFERGQGREDYSFPSGHASMGFYLMAPAFVFRRRRPRLALAFLALGLGAGSLIGLARIVAGAHFASDVLWAGGLMYFTALGLAAPFRFGQDGTIPDRRRQGQSV